MATLKIGGVEASNLQEAAIREKLGLLNFLSMIESGLQKNGNILTAEDKLALRIGLDIVGQAQGKANRNYKIVAGVIRNYDTAADGTGSSGWQLLTDGFHPPIGIETVDSLTNNSEILINYPNIGAARTVSVFAVADETLASAGFICGTSVEPDSCRIKIGRATALSDYLYYDTGSSSFRLDNTFNNLVPAGNRLEIAGVSGADVTISHPKLSNADRFSFSFTPRPGSGGVLYTPVIASDVGPSSSQSQFELNWYNGSTKVTVPDGNCRACVSRGHTSVNVFPNTVNNTTFPNGNIWIYGILQVEDEPD